MNALAASALALTAFVLFGLATRCHYEQRFGRRFSPLYALRSRMVAWTALTVSFAASIASWGWAFGPIAWIGLAMAGAATSFLVLNLVPQTIRFANPERRKVGQE